MNDDILDRQLREAAPYIDDDGFTRNVLQSLPPQRKRPTESFRAVILLSITLLGSVLAYLLSNGGQFIGQEMMRVASWSPLMLMLLAIGTGVLMTGLGVAAALAKQRDLQS